MLLVILTGFLYFLDIIFFNDGNDPGFLLCRLLFWVAFENFTLSVSVLPSIHWDPLNTLLLLLPKKKKWVPWIVSYLGHLSWLCAEKNSPFMIAIIFVVFPIFPKTSSWSHVLYAIFSLFFRRTTSLLRKVSFGSITHCYVGNCLLNSSSIFSLFLTIFLNIFSLFL